MNWLFLRGLTRESRHWGEFAKSFKRRNPGAKIHYLDLPGAGTQCDGMCPLSVRGMADDVRNRWLKLKERHRGPWSILGVSLGGMVALDWCARHPKDFKALVAINASAANVALPHSRLKPAAMLAVCRATLERDLVRRETIILKAVTAMSDIDLTAKKWSRIAEESPVSRANALRQLLAASLFVAPRKLLPKALFLASQGDGFADYTCSIRLARRYQSALAIHSQAGHELTIDDPDWASQQIASWLTTGRKRVVA